MIATDTIRKLNTSVVYVANQMDLSPGTPGLLLGADLNGLGQMIDAMESAPSQEGLVISSMRNQFTVTITPVTLQFDDRSGEEPARGDFCDRLVSVADFIGSLSNLTYAAVGLNYDIEWPPTDNALPSSVILRRLIRADVDTGEDSDIIGASARLWYSVGDIRYDLRIEPRGNQHDSHGYFGHLNAHRPLNGEVPSLEWLSTTLHKEYSGFKRSLVRLLDWK